MGVRTLDIVDLIRPDNMAQALTHLFWQWEVFRNVWVSEKRELRNYLFAIDTLQTTNAQLPWKNSTRIPKLTQIRDNLHANYMASLFPNDRPITWEGDDDEAEEKQKRQIIEAYMENKMRLGKFTTEISKCVLDYIDWGNCFAMTEFVDEKVTDPETGEIIQGFVGPRIRRISPLDIVFNPTAATFEEAPKIIRSVKTLGSIHADIQDHPELGYMQEVFDMVLENRQKFNGYSISDFAKTEAYQFDGFSSFYHYFTSSYVEILDFYGDFYDVHEKKLYKNYCITVVDRAKIIRKVPNPSWLGNGGIRHCGWRQRPDNLYAMGPLDNLVGMQYRIDHLENAKADAFDLIIHPVINVSGYVEDFEYGPGERIYSGEEGKVEFIHPDVTMLNADTQIALYENKMEEMAGSPKQAMGFRTPGEKTAYEVQVLENGANKIFLNKTAFLEENFMEPLLNDMLESGRRNMGISDTVRVLDDQYGAVQFMKITKEDIACAGRIRPVGARHYSRNANIVQNLTQLMNSAIGRDPGVIAHISGKRMAHLMEELLGLQRFKLVQDNIRVAEDLETQEAAQAAQQILLEKQNEAQQSGQAVQNGQPTGQPNQGQGEVGSGGQPKGLVGQIGPQAANGPVEQELRPAQGRGSGEPNPNMLATLSPRTRIGAIPQGATLGASNSVRAK